MRLNTTISARSCWIASRIVPEFANAGHMESKKSANTWTVAMILSRSGRAAASSIEPKTRDEDQTTLELVANAVASDRICRDDGQVANRDQPMREVESLRRRTGRSQVDVDPQTVALTVLTCPFVIARLLDLILDLDTERRLVGARAFQRAVGMSREKPLG